MQLARVREAPFIFFLVYFGLPWVYPLLTVLRKEVNADFVAKLCHSEISS